MRIESLMAIAVAIAASAASIACSSDDPEPNNPGTGGSSSRNDIIIVTDYFTPNGQSYASDAIQKLIDSNPNRTIYFPDGTYTLDKPIVTPADPKKSVALELSNYAVIKASSEWKHEEAMIRLGGKNAANDITTPGSNYYLDGGIVDGNGVAKGISIDGGRETAIRNTSIKNATLGLHVKFGANSGSSDCDISGVNITGDLSPNCIGVLVEGYDNTFTNMRIGGVHYGFVIRSSANCLRNIHPLYYSSFDLYYPTSCGFLDEAGCNWYDFCYSDEFATAFCNNGFKSTYNNCFAYWYSKRGEKHTAFKSNGRFESGVSNFTVGIRPDNATLQNYVLEVSEEGGNGFFSNLHVDDTSLLTGNDHEKYIK